MPSNQPVLSPVITAGDNIDFAPGLITADSLHLLALPNARLIRRIHVRPPKHTCVLSRLCSNLTALNGNYEGPTGQTFVGRRQQDTLFTYSVNLDFPPSVQEEEAGMTVILTHNHHLDLGVVMSPLNSSTTTFPGTNRTTTTSKELLPNTRFRGIICA
jgi:hypothetical protein